MYFSSKEKGGVRTLVDPSDCSSLSKWGSFQLRSLVKHHRKKTTLRIPVPKGTKAPFVAFFSPSRCLRKHLIWILGYLKAQINWFVNMHCSLD